MISNSVERIRNSAAYWIATPKREEIFFETAHDLNIQISKKLSHDCKTTYLMLHNALIYKTIFPHLNQRVSQYKYLPYDEDWMLAKEICDRMEIFFEVIELFSSTQYPIDNLYFPMIC